MTKEINLLNINTQSVRTKTPKISTLAFTDYAIERFWPGAFEW